MSFSARVVSPGMNALLTGKTAIIYGAAGGIGSATARTFAREGARVILAGRTQATLQQLADEIAGAGGQAEVAVLDATDERQVDDHAASLDRIDISFNLIFREDAQGMPLIDMPTDRYLHALTLGAKTAFLTARAAARKMVAGNHGGVILHLTSASSRGAAPFMGNTGPTDAATEAFYRYLAAETGPQGVRVVGIHTAGVRETLTDEKIAKVSGAGGPSAEQILAGIAQMTMLKRVPAVQQIADTATFLASDHAGAITSGIVNATCGLVAG
jgi:NAD(P)-dependent dehydrogenase (short-subunit alcohol dehydrogenase family)